MDKAELEMFDRFDLLVQKENIQFRELELKLQKHLLYRTSLGLTIAELLQCDLGYPIDSIYCYRCQCWSYAYLPYEALFALTACHPVLARMMYYHQWLTKVPSVELRQLHSELPSGTVSCYYAKSRDLSSVFYLQI